MRHNLVCLVIICINLMSTFGNAQESVTYLLAFIPHQTEIDASQIHYEIHVAGNYKAATAHLFETNGRGKTTIAFFKDLTPDRLRKQIIYPNSGISRGLIWSYVVTASAPIYLAGLSATEQSSSDVFAVYPLNIYRTKFVLAVHEKATNLLVLAPLDGTFFSLTFKERFNPVLQKALSRYQGYFWKAGKSQTLSGSLLSSTSPVTVICGSRTSRVEIQARQQWGTEFVVIRPHITGFTYSMTVCVRRGTAHLTWHVSPPSPGNFTLKGCHQYDISKKEMQASILTSKQKVVVTVTLHGGSLGEASAIVVPKTNFLPTLETAFFSGRDKAPFTKCLLLFVTNKATEISINGKTTLRQNNELSPVNGSQLYTYAIHDVKCDGNYTISGVGASKMLGAYIYGQSASSIFFSELMTSKFASSIVDGACEKDGFCQIDYDIDNANVTDSPETTVVTEERLGWFDWQIILIACFILTFLIFLILVLRYIWKLGVLKAEDEHLRKIRSQTGDSRRLLRQSVQSTAV